MLCLSSPPSTYLRRRIISVFGTNFRVMPHLPDSSKPLRHHHGRQHEYCSSSSPPSRPLRTSPSPHHQSEASQRLKLVSGHLELRPSRSQVSRILSGKETGTRSIVDTLSPGTMSTQPPHAALLIPGPIEFDDAVLHSMGHFSESHVGPAFVSIFGESLTMLRKLFQTTAPASQPFIISGSGTLGWDMVSANLIEPSDEVLVVNTGYFSDSFSDCLTAYGASITHVRAPSVGGRPSVAEIEAALKTKKFKAMTITHVDTSTAVLTELADLCAMVKKTSPDTLIVVDGVCSVACEEIRFDEWGIDVVITASQKAIGCPAGLSISMWSERAMETVEGRKAKVTAYFAKIGNWLPIMKNYEAKKPSYFATPSPQLVRALHTALTLLLSQPLSERFARHKEVSDKVKAAVAKMGLKQVAAKPEDQAHGMTAIYLPEGVKGMDLLPLLVKAGVIFAGGLHKEIAPKYIRFGHMGVSVMDPKRPEIDTAIKALETGLVQLGFLIQ